MTESVDQRSDDAQSECGPTQRPTLSIDCALYEKYLAEADLTETQKRDFLEALWSIVVSFVDLGFGVHPVQQSCGQPENVDGDMKSSPPDMVGLNDNSIAKPFVAVAASNEPRAEREKQR